MVSLFVLQILLPLHERNFLPYPDSSILRNGVRVTIVIVSIFGLDVGGVILLSA